MGRCVRRAADLYLKQDGPGRAADPNEQKTDEIAIRLGQSVGVALIIAEEETERCSHRPECVYGLQVAAESGREPRSVTFSQSEKSSQPSPHARSMTLSPPNPVSPS